MRISIILWAGNLVPTGGEFDLDRLADDFSQRVRQAVAERFPNAHVSVRVEDGEELETAVRIEFPEGPEAEQAEAVVREIVDAEWGRLDFDAYAPSE